MRQFERLLVSLDQSVMSGAMLQSCIEQDFEVTPLDDEGGPSMIVDVRNNKVGQITRKQTNVCVDHGL